MKNTVNITVALPAYYQTHTPLFKAICQENADIEKVLLTGKESQSPLGEALLFDLLCSNKVPSPAFAAVAALGEGFEESAWWLRIDPIELMVDAGNIALIGRDHLNITKEEVDQLLVSLNALIQENNLIIKVGATHRWYLPLNDSPEITTSPLSLAIAKDIRPYLPQGKRANEWNRLITELQMLLYSHSVNYQRQIGQQSQINSLWLWGEGRITSAPLLKSYQTIWSDDPISKGLLLLAGTKQAQGIAKLTLEPLLSPGDHLIILDFMQQESAFFISLFTQLMLALKERKITRLKLCLGSGVTFNWQAPRWLLGRLLPRLVSKHQKQQKRL